MGDQADGELGLRPTATSSRGTSAIRAGSTSAFRRTSSSPVKDQLTCEVAGVDAGHQRPGDRARLSADPAGASDRGPARRRSSTGAKDKVKGQIVLVGKSVAVPVNLNPPAEAPPGRGRARAVRSEQSRRRPRPRAAATPAATRRPARCSTNEINRRDRRVPRRQRRARARQRRRPRARPDHRLQQPDVRRRRRRCRPSSCATRTTAASRAFSPTARRSSSSSTSRTRCIRKAGPSYNTIAEIPGSDKKDEIVMLGGHLDSWHSATGATDNAIGCAIDDGGGAHPEGDRRPAAADDPRRALERRRGRAARLAGLRQGALRIVREPEAGVREARRLSEHRLRHRPRARRRRLRSAGGGGDPAPDAGAVRRPRRRRRVGDAQPHGRRHRQHVVQQRRAAGHRLRPGSRSNTTRTRTTRTSTTTSASSKATSRTSAIVIAATLYQLAMRDEMVPRFAPSDMPPPVPRNSSAQ